MAEYNVSEICYDANGNVVFNEQDVNQNGELTEDMKEYIETELDDYVRKTGDEMTGGLILPTLQLTNSGNQIQFSDLTYQRSAFTRELNTALNETINKTTFMSASISDILTTFESDVLLNNKKLLFLSGEQNYPYTNEERNMNLSSNTKLTNTTYNAGLLKTSISNNLYAENLTCGNINTSHLNGTTSNLQQQLNTLNSGNTKYITSDNNWNTTIGGTIITGNVYAGGLITATNIMIDDVSLKNNFIPVGTVQIYAGLSNNIPTGFLLCNGARVSKTTYASLWSVLGDTYLYGRTSSTTQFYIPDLQGMFIRGRGTNTVYAGVVGATNTGMYQNDNVQKHSHEYDKANNTIDCLSNVSGTGLSLNINKSSVWDNSSDVMNTTSTLYNTDGTEIFLNETRPHNISMNYIIKF